MYIACCWILVIVDSIYKFCCHICKVSLIYYCISIFVDVTEYHKYPSIVAVLE